MPASRSRIAPALLIGLTLAIVLDTAVQVLWKKAADKLPSAAGTPPLAVLDAVVHQPLFLLVGVLIAAQMFNWLKTLDHADVSFAQPITALSYVSVALVSKLWFGEAITLGRVGGMALILAGVFLVARSDPNSEPSDTAKPDSPTPGPPVAP